VQTFYAGKEERANLRQMLIDTRRGSSKNGTGWEVLITTYNLAQGDDKDRKFFRKMEWDVSQIFALYHSNFFTCDLDYRFRRGTRLEELPVPALPGIAQIRSEMAAPFDRHSFAEQPSRASGEPNLLTCSV
jgi:hypothetical protein